MRALRQAIRRLIALTRGTRMDRELDDEILAHLELAERDLIAAGWSPREARREARQRFGGVEQVREAQRDARSAQGLDALARDVRYACSLLARDPGFTIVAVGILALGIGANAAMFSLVDAVLLKPLPFPRPERVVRLWEAPTPTSINATTPGNFTEWKRRSTSFAALAAESRWESDATALIGGEPTRLSGKRVSADYFDVFGLKPQLGRTFAAGEDQPGAAPVVVLSHAAWQSFFSADPGVLNQDLVLDGERHRIVGVMAPGIFDRDDMAAPGEDPAAFWKPLIFTPTQLSSGEHWLAVTGRLGDGISLAQASEDVRAIHAVLARDFPESQRDWSAAVEPFDERLVDNRLRQSLYVAFGAVILVLIIACANVANLLLAKGAARQREITVRAALGASRSRLVRQLLTEALVLCVLGAAAGLVLASYLIGAATPLLPRAIPSTAVVSLDYRVFGFTAAAALAVTLLVGILPSLRSSRAPLSQALNHASRGSSGTGSRLRGAVVVAEMALSVVLICGAVLLFRSLLNLQRVDLGVRVDNVVTISTNLPAIGYSTPDAALALYGTLLERVTAVAAVERATLADDAPLEGAGGENLRIPERNERLLVRYKRVGPDYFSALGIPVIAGREFTSADRPGAERVTVISPELARALSERFGVAQPVGAVVTLPALGYLGGSTRVPMRIVGVIRGERVQRDLRLPMEPVAYVPITQSPRHAVNLIVRTSGAPSAVVGPIREVVKQIDAGLALSRVRTMAEIRRQRSLTGTTEQAWVVGAFACVAALLAGLGLYGVIGHTVVQQRREIGIRLALGASGREILARVLGQASRTIAAGVAVGIGGAVVLMRVLSSLLFGISPLDPPALALAAAAIAVVGLAAAALPARRASRLDPSAVLRSEG